MAAKNVSVPELGSVISLPTFLGTAGQLTLDEQKLVAGQALVMLQSAYVHLPLKRAMHAIDPLQALSLMQRQLAQLTLPMPERRFHDEMIDIFVSLRDLHTNYILPSYFSKSTAFLPFYMEEAAGAGGSHYVVSKVFQGFTDANFKAGVTIHHWNGVPIARAVERNADLNAGSNTAARHARGLEAMTIRPMAMTLPPDEEWVIVGFTANGVDKEIRLSWQVFRQDGLDSTSAMQPSGKKATARKIGMDFQTEAVRRAKVRLFFPAVTQKRLALNAARALGAAAPAAAANPLPDVLSCKTVDTPSGKVGYLRIYTFAPPVDGDNFLGTFQKTVIDMLGQLPQTGLIIDVRGNGGGYIEAGENLLQLFTPKRISPERFDFVNTPVTREITSMFEDLKQWNSSVTQAVETGSAYSQAFPLTSDGDANSIGQVYQGPVVLITDALIYSTTDIFSAGFHDHGIGPILGTSGNVGAGGANVWNYSDLQGILSDAFQPLPKGIQMRVAVRRATRVGEMIGMPLEELGVIPDELHPMTENDIFNDNADLIAHAAKMLQGQKVRKLTGTIVTSGGARALTLTTQNLTRADVYINGRPALSLDVKDGDTSTGLKLSDGAIQIYLEGYDGEDLVAARNLSVSAAQAAGHGD